MSSLSAAYEINRSGRRFDFVDSGVPILIAAGIVALVLFAAYTRNARHEFLREFAIEYKGDFVCPHVREWPKFDAAARRTWTSYWLDRGYSRFEKSEACFMAPKGVSSWDAINRLPESQLTAAARLYGAIACPKPDRLAVATVADIEYWKSVGASFGPAIAGSTLCYDP